MIILIVLYGFYLVLLLTNTPLMYVIDKTVLLFVWYYFFYKALFLKVVVLEHSFKSGWDLPYQEDDNDDDEHRVLSKRYAEEVSAWFERKTVSSRRFTSDGFATDLPYQPFLSFPIV